jgi:hypothetical protein
VDFTKEFTNHFSYDLGFSYLPQQKSLEEHGRLIIPIFPKQAFYVEY